MPTLSADTPLYNHSLPQIEQWLKDQGCQQDETELHCWRLQKPSWQAELWLDIEQITVRYIQAAEPTQNIQRSFKYSLSRQDIQAAVFSGP
ncbi:DUF3143 domain-containing protein [Anabaena sp. UHCC 0451]|uniref:DUF3143 domain-containing protein n=1 Tax=Anabaena sp. UHCC 0451 TaxID=2055235 RepID=UPI002B1FA9F7|nr:DUF3143 domain-containing protein [Anabaena sp. UHCC 0451]MEA5576792.1 DUF3143 domain-containing protein [Anabaena sp. UHCC 0451]